MPTHYLTLSALCRELDASLRGATIDEIYTQRKNELILSGRYPPDSVAGAEAFSLPISVEPKFNYLFLRDHVARAKRNSVNLFADLDGKRIGHFGIHSTERTLFVACTGELTLTVVLYNTAESNVLLVDAANTIREAFKSNRALRGSAFTPPVPCSDLSVLQHWDAFVAALEHDPARSISESLRALAPMLGSLYTREILHRAALRSELPVGDLSVEERRRVYWELHSVLGSVDQPQPHLYPTQDGRTVVSLMPLQHRSDLSSEQFPTANDAVRAAVTRTFRAHHVTEVKNPLLVRITNELNRARRSLEAVVNEISRSARAEEYERIGTHLMANLNAVTRGMKSIELADLYREGETVQAALDPTLTPVRNAERYFDRARKARAARIQAEDRRRSLERRVELLGRLHSDMATLETRDDIQAFMSEHRKELSELGLGSTGKEEKPVPFRVFTVAAGFEVWVGKSSASNDLLTTKYARPNDLWFHARGASGSHTVLRVTRSSVKPPKDAIRQAASIAAYYSKMRNAKSVPVAYCERKYVRKPKGVREGTVLLEREEVIFVEPRLPDSSERMAKSF